MVTYEPQGQIAVITIHRPEARNAINGDVAQAMEAAIDQLEADDGVWVGVLTGEGTVFCAGADLKAIAGGQALSLSTERGGFAGLVSRERKKPLVAAVDGPALAGGCEIALSCDLIVASTAASFGVPEVKRSLVAAAGGLFRLPRALPRAVAMEAILTGDPLTAERALRYGLINELVEPGQALEAAKTLAQRIAVNAPLAVQASRRLVLEAGGGDEGDLFRRSGAAMAELMGTEDFSEGPRAFIEKRLPEWKGR